MAIDLTARYKAVLSAGVRLDVTAGGIPVGSAGSFYLKLSNTTASEIAVQPLAKGTGASPAAADTIHPSFTIEADGWWDAQPVKMGEGEKLWITANGALVVELVGRKEG